MYGKAVMNVASLALTQSLGMPPLVTTPNSKSMTSSASCRPLSVPTKPLLEEVSSVRTSGRSRPVMVSAVAWS